MVAILSTFRELDRLRQISIVLTRHGFGELARRLALGKKSKADDAKGGESEPPDESAEAPTEMSAAEAQSPLAERVRLVAMDLGPSFVKLGQIASTRADVLPQDWIRELKKLQDSVSPLPYAEIKAAVEASLGSEIATLYERFDPEPLAAASIGQVHRAVLKHEDGPEDVVVKVQRPGVRTTVARDLELLHHLAKLLERTIPESRMYSPSGLVEEFDRAITNELDFTLEGENATRFRKNFEGHASVRFPRVYKEASSKQVLTLEFLPGKKVYDAIEKDGFSGERIARTAVGVVIKMIFEDGFFHADPHPGNILISGTPEAPVIGLVDLGMVGRLSPEMRDRCIDLMVAAGRNDHLGVADALYQIGTPTKKVDMRAYRAEVSMLSEKYLNKPLKEIDLAAMIGDLVKGAQKFGIEVPSDFLLVGKALMTIEGVGKEIYPDLDVFGESKPFFIELLKKRYSPERIGNDLLRGIGQVSSSAYDLPQLAREVLEDLRLGRLMIATTDAASPLTFDRLGRRIFSGFVVGSFALGGAWLLGQGKETWGAVLLAVGVLVMLGHVFVDLVRRWK